MLKRSNHKYSWLHINIYIYVAESWRLTERKAIIYRESWKILGEERAIVGEGEWCIGRSRRKSFDFVRKHDAAAEFGAVSRHFSFFFFSPPIFEPRVAGIFLAISVMQDGGDSYHVPPLLDIFPRSASTLTAQFLSTGGGLFV